MEELEELEKKYERTKKKFKEEIEIAKKTDNDLNTLSDKAFKQKYKKTKRQVRKDMPINEGDLSKIKNGIQVKHSRFGEGKVISIAGEGSNKKATIFFCL